ncbi:lycopene cyclase domain-containing protein [Amycolatopsis regifaucium]|uniref:Lycopene cyclase n=1 Tax=Amycolatopsis regifaucium TaxID=546365 RepID=A0A154MVA9_9PSEU|nr:lycopene cyclase domain-containing protein [Amycolatopsis regifaucium]KZB88278.1 lycopene cyclase [Amycolatopsis regifaucium]OKA11390.1 lycopene cyclase [Amycolatopsis regifaucium]SFH43030.1 lycopene cyclase domain-containing protein [Amycolatopsis regifaucium]
MGKVEYLVVLAACVLVTLPLELAGARVYRQPKRLARALLPVAVVFLVWDALAIAGEVWTYAPEFVTGIRAPFSLPLEEILFFVVIPICGVLTYEAVQLTLTGLRRSGKQGVRR